MKYVIEQGSNNHLIITLHGTGGDARSLFEIASIIDPLANKVGFLGQVNENGMNRYFARYPQGGYDLDSLAKATHELFESIFAMIEKHNFENHKITVLGYSNGANIAKNLLKEYVNFAINNMLLFHPSPITPNVGYKDQKGLNVLITSGENDPYITMRELLMLSEVMSDANMNVKTFSHSLGHQLTQEELEVAKAFLSENLGEV